MYVRKTEDYVAVYATGIVGKERKKLTDEMVFIGGSDKEMMAFVKEYLRIHKHVDLEVRRGRMKVGELALFKEAREQAEQRKEPPETMKENAMVKTLREEIDTLTKQLEDLNEFVHKYVSHKREMEYAGYRRQKAAR